jgi:long-chain acyl-CoA synthetase
LRPGSARQDTEDLTQKVSGKSKSRLESPSRGPDGSQPRLGLSSSGSTGEPKLIWRAWTDLFSEISVAALWNGWTWASPYDPNTFAGVQIALQAWANEGEVISLKGNCDAAWDLLHKNHTEALACTPTFADLLIQSEIQPKSRWQPKQITLGGEVLRHGLGNRLRNRFPSTRFTVIYATTELGIILKTHRLDGWYELNWLEDHSICRRINGETLEIQKGEGWRTTGDKVEIKGDLIRVVGRADAIANVAGTKVNLAEISDLAEAVPGVRRALAVAEPSLITGEIVCLRYAVDPDFDECEVTRSLKLYLQNNLQKEAWPRRWDLDPLQPVRNAKRAVR